MKVEVGMDGSGGGDGWKWRWGWMEVEVGMDEVEVVEATPGGGALPELWCPPPPNTVFKLQ